MLQLIDVSVKLGNFQLSQINLSLNQKEYLIVIGRNGSGKTTLLKTIAGAYSSATGKIMLDNEDISAEPPEKRNIGYVSQSFISFDNLNVYGNIEFGLRVRGIPKEEREPLAKDMASQLGIDGLLQRPAATLSGGEQQRVSLARTLVTHPKVLLLDEPFSMLDPQTKRNALRLLKEIPQWYNVPVVHVTHEWDEAYTLADRVAVMDDGRIIEFDTSEKIFEAPASYQTATLVGFENIYRGHAAADGSGSEVKLENGLRLTSNENYSGAVYVCVRPEKVVVSNDQNGDCLRGKIAEVFRERLGYRVIVNAENMEITAFVKDQLSKEQEVSVTIPRISVHLIPAK